jgi:Mannosyltransferase (PIG-V)
MPGILAHLPARLLAPFWLLVGIRAVFWIGAALAFLWSPAAVAGGNTVFRAYEARSDLLFGTFAEWDSGWYVAIAEHGYESRQSSAYFPLYPLLVRAVSAVTGSTVVAGVLISFVAAGVAAILIAELARPLLGVRGARDSVLFLALYPAAFVFTSIYTDGLFLALSAGAFLAAMRQRSWLAGILGGLAVATRLLGLALLPALLLLLWPRGRSLRELARPLPLLALPAALGAYALYLDRHLGSWDLFAEAQREFWQRHTPTLGPLGGLWESADFAYHGAAQLALHLPRTGETFDRFDQIAVWFVLHFLLLLAAIALTWVAWRRLGAAFGLYSVTTLVVLLSSTVTWFPLASLPRYLLADFPLFLALASLTLERPRARTIVLCSFAAVGAVAAVAFSRHVWVA